MNTDDHDQERLSRVLSRHPMPAPTRVELDQVMRRAGEIRRRRRALTTGAAALGVLAVLTPMTFMRAGDEVAPAPAASSTPSPTPSSSATVTATPSPSPSSAPTTTAPGTSNLSTLPVGSPMRASWIKGNTVNWLNGDTTTLDGDSDWSKFASYHGGVLAVRGGPVTQTVDEFDNSGALVESHEGSGIAVSQDGSQTAWWWRTKTGDAIHVGSSSGKGDTDKVIPTPTSKDEYVQIAGFTESGEVVYTVLSQTDTKTTAYVTDGTKSTPITELSAATSVGPGDLVSGDLASGVSAVISLGDRSSLWKGNDVTSTSVFSNDGAYVATFDPGDGNFSSLQIREARSGKVVSSWSYDNSTMSLDGPMQWEDDTHLLAPMLASKGAGTDAGTMVRLATDGSIESAGTYPFPESQEFPFSTQP